MNRIKVLGLAFLMTLIVALAPSSALANGANEPYENWVIREGDWIHVELSTNTMRFHRWDSSVISDPMQVGSGLDIDGKISYAGAYYNPRTPSDVWMIKENNRQTSFSVFGTLETDENGDRITEKPFLRLYRKQSNGEGFYRTKYGVHTTPYFDRIVENKDGYGSYGCILTDYHLLKFVEEMYEFQKAAGQDGLMVVTTRAN